MNKIIESLIELYELNISFDLAHDSASSSVEKLIRNPLESDQSYFCRQLSCFNEAIRLASKAREIRQMISVKRISEQNHYLTFENESLADFAQKLFKGEEFSFDRFLNRVIPNDPIPEVDESDELVSKVFYNWISGADYINRCLEVYPLIVPVDVGHSVRCFLDSAIRSYAFGIDNAVFSMCRTIIESAVLDICERKHFLTQLPEKAREKAHNFRKLLYHCTEKSEEMKKQISTFYYDVFSPVIHANGVARGDSLRILRDTIGIVRELYLANPLNDNRI